MSFSYKIAITDVPAKSLDVSISEKNKRPNSWFLLTPRRGRFLLRLRLVGPEPTGRLPARRAYSLEREERPASSS